MLNFFELQRRRHSNKLITRKTIKLNSITIKETEIQAKKRVNFLKEWMVKQK